MRAVLPIRFLAVPVKRSSYQSSQSLSPAIWRINRGLMSHRRRRNALGEGTSVHQDALCKVTRLYSVKPAQPNPKRSDWIQPVLPCDSKSLEVSPSSLFPLLSRYRPMQPVVRGGGRSASGAANETIYFVGQLELPIKWSHMDP